MTVFNVGGSDTFVYNVKVECELMPGMGGAGVTSGLHGNKGTEERKNV